MPVFCMNSKYNTGFLFCFIDFTEYLFSFSPYQFGSFSSEQKNRSEKEQQNISLLNGYLKKDTGLQP